MIRRRPCSIGMLVCFFGFWGAAAGSQPLPVAGAVPVGDRVAERASGAVNLKDPPYGALGDGFSCQDGTISAGSASLASMMCTFDPQDVGKYLILHGSGAGGSAQLGTITSIIDAHHVRLSFTAAEPTRVISYYSATVATPQSGSGSYAPGDTALVLGGQGSAARFTVAATQAVSATIVNPGSGGSNGACLLTVVGGRYAAPSQFSATVSDGRLSAIQSVGLPGRYLVNPPNLAASSVITTCGLRGATIDIRMGAASVAAEAPGVYSAAVANPAATSTNGKGTGLTLALVPYVTGRFSYGSDDTAAVSKAIAAAREQGRCVFIPSGNYLLASQNAPIPLDHVCLRGEGIGGNAWPFDGGSKFWLFNQTSAAFGLVSDTSIEGLGFYYPLQDSSGRAPIRYPPTFESASFINDTFSNWRVMNAYDLFHVTPPGVGAGWGRVFIDHSLVYCIDKCFWFQNGAADTLQIGPTSYFGPGAYGSEAAYGPAVLARYTNSAGEWLRLDIAGGAYPQFDGMMLTGFIIQAARYGIRLMSGQLDVSAFSNVNFDSVATALSVEGASRLLSTSWSGGEIYSINPYNPMQAADVIDVSSHSAAVELSITGLKLAYAQGGFLVDRGMGISTLNLVGNDVHNFGHSETAGTYFAVAVSSDEQARLNIVGNVFSCGQFEGHVLDGVAVGAGSANIQSNLFSNCHQPVALSGNTGFHFVNGNQSLNTAAPHALLNTTVRPAIVASGVNSWDRQ